jgi:hypothetical protein
MHNVCATLVTIVLVAACVPSRTEQPATFMVPTAISETPPYTPTNASADTVEPLTPTTTPLPAVIPASTSGSSDLPDLALGLGSGEPEFVCTNEARGQIWLTTYPYITVTILLADEKGTSYSQPRWSPDGQWIAFVKSDPRSTTDSIWTIRPDGSEMHKVSDEFPRQEVTVSGVCVPNAGIINLIGWSPDGRWLTFFYRHLEADQTIEQKDWYLVNIEQGQTRLIQKEIQLPLLSTWSPDGLQLAFADDLPRIDWRVPHGTKQITVLEVEQSALLTSDAFSLPSEVPGSFEVDQLFWGKSGSVLYASLYDTAYRPLGESPSFLWRLDVQQKEWQKETDLGPAHNIVYSQAGDFVAACREEADGSVEVSLFDLVAHTLSKSVDQPRNGCALIRIIEDKAGNKLLGFVSPPLGNEVWVTPIGENATSQQVLNGKALGFPDDFSIFSVSWGSAP